MQLQAFDLLVFKEANPGHKVLYINICGMEFVFRTLGKKEYRDILNVCSNEYDLEDMICQVALVYPEDFDFNNCPFGGITKTISPLIIDLSGFTNKESIYAMYFQHQEEMNEFENTIYAIIKMAFGEYTFEEMELWSWDHTLKILTRAQYILNKTICKDDPIELVQVEEEIKPINYDDNKVYKDLIKEGIDPLIHFYKDLKDKYSFVDFPLIGSIHWNNEEIMSEIQLQMARSRIK